MLRKGAVLYVPKALRFDRFVAGQVIDVKKLNNFQFYLFVGSHSLES